MNACLIPIFTSQLEKARESTDEANLRSAYAECSSAVLSGTNPGSDYTYSDTNGVITCSKEVTLTQKNDNWENNATPEIGGVKLGNAITANKKVKVTVVNDGSVATFTQENTNLKAN